MNQNLKAFKIIAIKFTIFLKIYYKESNLILFMVCIKIFLNLIFYSNLIDELP